MLNLITSPFIPEFEFHWFHLYFIKIFLSPLPLPIIMEFLEYTSMCETGVNQPKDVAKRLIWIWLFAALFVWFLLFSLSKGPNSTFPLMPMCVGNQGSDRQALAYPVVMSSGITTSRRSRILLARHISLSLAEAVDRDPLYLQTLPAISCHAQQWLLLLNLWAPHQHLQGLQRLYSQKNDMVV